eukprot:158793-Chlamydomonas_euryale.AAC.5
MPLHPRTAASPYRRITMPLHHRTAASLHRCVAASPHTSPDALLLLAAHGGRALCLIRDALEARALARHAEATDVVRGRLAAGQVGKAAPQQRRKLERASAPSGEDDDLRVVRQRVEHEVGVARHRVGAGLHVDLAAKALPLVDPGVRVVVKRVHALVLEAWGVGREVNAHPDLAVDRGEAVVEPPVPAVGALCAVVALLEAEPLWHLLRGRLGHLPVAPRNTVHLQVHAVPQVCQQLVGPRARAQHHALRLDEPAVAQQHARAPGRSDVDVVDRRILSQRPAAAFHRQPHHRRAAGAGVHAASGRLVHALKCLVRLHEIPTLVQLRRVAKVRVRDVKLLHRLRGAPDAPLDRLASVGVAVEQQTVVVQQLLA